MTDPINQAVSPPASKDPEQERDVFEIRRSPKAFVGQLLLGVLLLPVFGIGVLLLLGVWYKVYAMRYRLSTMRFFITRGLIARHVEELDLFRIKDISLVQGVLQRLLGVGTITILSTDDTNPRIKVSGINQPLEIKEILRIHYRAARQREGVRSAEFISS